jgi:sugar lactone lactonase YvrE
MYASTVEGARGPSGRLLQYDPSTDEVAVLARGLWFANGVAVDKEENYLVFVETFKLRIAKYFLAGDKQGTIEYIVNGDPSPACK